jgi:ABC-type transporter Mla subunit MlaD
MGALPNPVRKESNAIEAATLRLSAALDALESAIEQRRETDVQVEGHAARVHAFGVDRSRLADELDRTQAHAQTLEKTNRDVAARIDTAIGAIRRVLGPEMSE